MRPAPFEEEIRQLRLERRYLSQRKIGRCSEGIVERIICAFCNASAQHFSVSCPNITSSVDEFNFIRNERLCQYCLTNCRPGRRRYLGNPAGTARKSNGQSRVSSSSMMEGITGPSATYPTFGRVSGTALMKRKHSCKVREAD